MGKILQTTLAIILTFFIIGLMSSALYTQSPDPAEEKNFTLYTEYQDYSYLSEHDVNLSYNNTENPQTNFRLLAENIQGMINEADVSISSGSVLERLSGYFGLSVQLVIQVLQVLLMVIGEGINLIFGIGSNLGNLPAPWNFLGILYGLAITLFIVFIIFKIINTFAKWDV